MTASIDAWLRVPVRFEPMPMEYADIWCRCVSDNLPMSLHSRWIVCTSVRWRLLVEDGRNAGHTFSQPDLFIAATALQHGLTLVSRDVADYANARVALFNPCVDAAPADQD